MGLHARYYPLPQDRLSRLLGNPDAEARLQELFAFRRECGENGEEYIVGTSWHLLDFLINPPDAAVPELAYAVRGHEFPAPDGSVRVEPHLPSYDDEPWQLFTYVPADEVAAVSQFLSLLTPADFEARYRPAKMKELYRAPVAGEEHKGELVELALKFAHFYDEVARAGNALLISVG
ncbi:MAG TPA: DUF1877 family protein [Thermoanaerobaculia bacterium]|jgi:hypothetical protein